MAENQKVKLLSEKFIGGHEVDFGWTTEAFFKITNFSFFDIS